MTPIQNCTCMNLTFTLTNAWSDDQPMAPVDLDLLLFNNAYAFCDNPGFVNTNTTLVFQGIPYEIWRMPGVSIPSMNNGGILKIKARVKVVGFIDDPNRSLAYRATYGTNVIGPNPGPLVILDGTFYTVGTGPGSVNNLTDVATGASGFLAAPPAGPGQDVVINGQLNIDADYTFGGGSNIFLRENASIKVLDGNEFTLLDKTRVRSCEQPWKGIEVMDGGRLTMDGLVGASQCTPPCVVSVEDAEIAVRANNGATVFSNKILFLNNQVGIYTPPKTTAGPNYVSLYLYRNTFESNEFALLSGFAGLYLNDLSFAVVGSNTYKKMNYGIYGTNTNLITSYDEFSDLDYAGIAMTGNGHFLYQVGKGNSLATPTFSNVITGVRTLGMSVYITENGMSGVTSGVRAYLLNNKNAFVFDNTIAARNNGVLVSSLRPLNYSTIENNTITMDGNADGRGINSISTNIGTAPYVRINGNTINLFNATYGVDMMANRGVEAKGNTVTIGNPQTGFGMAVGGGGTNHLLGNFLNAASLINEQYGISVGQSLQGEYGCNHFSGTRTGLWFTGPNASSDIAGNDFNGFLFGLQVGNGGAPGSPNLGGFTGTQSHRGNMWNSAPPATGFGAIHYSQDQNEVINSQLEVDVIDGANLISTQKTFVQGTNYFVQLPGSTYTCPSNLIGSDPSAQLGIIEQGIASGSTTVGTFAAENWTAKRQLYRLLKANPSLAPQGSVYDAYLGNEANSTVGRFEDLQVAIDDMLAGDASSRSQLAGYVSGMGTKFDEVKTIEDGLIAQPGNSSLLAQRSAKLAEIVTLAGQSQALEQSMLAVRVSAASQLLSTNAAIAASSTHEANQKTANRILLETVANDQVELTGQQVADLTPIAVQCPYSGGEGVYAARGLLGNETVYNDFAACGMGSGGGQLIKAPEPGKSILPSFSIYPNPANGYVVVQMDKKLDEAGSLTLANTFGVQVLVEMLMEGTEAVPLDTAHLPAGTYFLTLRTSTGKRSSILVISR
jgi:type IX secretion system substrate protein